MPDDRVHVWVQRFKDRKHLMLQWLDLDTGQRKSRSAETDDEDKAEQARADLEYELNHGKYQEASRMTWERFRELFEQEYLSGRRPGTQKKYRHVFDCFERMCHPSRLRSITERAVSTFAAAMRAEKPTGSGGGYAPNTIKVSLQLLHTALSWAADQKMLPAVPKFPSVKVPKKKPQPIPAESFERLLMKTPDDETKAYLLCGWLGGLRLNEAFCLEREPTQKAPYLDLPRGRIVLPAEFAKADEDQWVPLDPLLQKALEALPPHGKKVFHFTTRGGRPITANGVSQRIIALAHRAGVKLTMHSLRKGFGCRYAGKVPAQVLQRLMRHADIKTTMAFYANVDEAVEAAVRGGCNTSRNTPRPEGAQEGAPAGGG
jgi:integrase